MDIAVQWFLLFFYLQFSRIFQKCQMKMGMEVILSSHLFSLIMPHSLSTLTLHTHHLDSKYLCYCLSSLSQMLCLWGSLEFLAAPAALYLTSVSELVTQSHFLNLTQRVIFDKWYTSNIWRRKNKKATWQKDKITKRQKNKKAKRQNYKMTMTKRQNDHNDKKKKRQKTKTKV